MGPLLEPYLLTAHLFQGHAVIAVRSTYQSTGRELPLGLVTPVTLRFHLTVPSYSEARASERSWEDGRLLPSYGLLGGKAGTTPLHWREAL